MSQNNVASVQYSLLQNSQPPEHSPFSFKRLVRINKYFVAFFVALYLISYFEVVKMPRLKLNLSMKSEKAFLPSTHSLLEEDDMDGIETTSLDFTTTEETSSTRVNEGTSEATNYKREDDLACKIPKLDPFDQSIQNFIKKEENLPKCQQMYPEVFQLGFNSSVVRVSNTTEWQNCCYKVMTRTTKKSDKMDSIVEFSQTCVPMPNEVTEIPQDVEYIGIFCHIPERQRKELNISSASQVLIDAFAFTHVKAELNSTDELAQNLMDYDEKLNVVVFGLDATSRLNFMRIMPEAHNFLIQNLSAISMEGYVKVGANTFPNLAPALTSMNESTLRQLCEKEGFFDDCPLIWKKFGAAGYLTSYGEDAPWMGTFNYLKGGFRSPPVDYYLRPAAVVLEKQLGSDHRANAKICSGPRLAIDVVLNYLQKLALLAREAKRRYFQFLWSTSLTHDFLNQGQLGENATLQTIKWMQENGYLNNTALILMSDHGLLHGKFLKTKQGMLEQNLPFVYFVFPEWFRKKYPVAFENMENNRKRLSTPFDLHETLLDVLKTKNLEDEEIRKRDEGLNEKRKEKRVPRGISLFLPIPPERTCEMAEIKEHFCACHEVKSLESESSLAQQAANFAVFELNSYVSKFIDCAFLSLQKVSSAFVFNSPKIAENFTTDQVVKVEFSTFPGNGEFEGTVVRHLVKNRTESWLLSDISRINLYGNQSHCIEDKPMKKYCYCIDLLKKLRRK